MNIRVLHHSLYAFCRTHLFKMIFCILLCCVLILNAIKWPNFVNHLSNNFSFVSLVHNPNNETQDEDTLDSMTSIDPLLFNKTFESRDNLNVTLTTAPELPNCPQLPPKLVGPLKVHMDGPSFYDMEGMFPDLKPGGRFAPKDCTSRHRVAIVIPIRNREEHLRIFLYNLHPFLMRQQLDYGIYVVEQYGDYKFNRGMLMNIGYVESLKQHDYQCLIFHDVDLIPEDDRNIYSCPEQPRHMAVAIDKSKYKLPYGNYFGGVTALTTEQMQKVNGFSNAFWGWGGEDDDFFNRVNNQGFHIIRYNENVARYKMLQHEHGEPSPDRFDKLYKGNERFESDGLVNLKYKIRNWELRKLFTWLLAEIEPP